MADLDAMRATGVEPSTVFAWVARDGTGKVLTDAKGRPVINFTERGLASLVEAVTSFGHEVKHIKDYAAGLEISDEREAEIAGQELWELVQERWKRR